MRKSTGKNKDMAGMARQYADFLDRKREKAKHHSKPKSKQTRGGWRS